MGLPENWDLVRAKVREQQQRMKALGLPWYGGYLPGRKKVLSRMEKAVEVADAILSLDREDEGAVVVAGEHAVVLREGSLEGLKLQRDTVLLVHERLKAEGAEIDVKLLRAGNEAAAALTKLAIRASEGEFRSRRDNVLERLLGMLEAQREEKK